MKKLLVLVTTLLAFSCSEGNFDLNSDSVNEKTPEEKVVDPCQNIACDHGDCINGQCDCIEGYKGPRCNKEITPTKIEITKVILKKFPITKSNGAGWDLNSGPDLLFRIIKENSNQTLYRSQHPYKNCTSGKTYYFGGDATIEIEDPHSQYSFKLIDADEGLFLDHPDEVVDWLSFKVYTKGEAFPSYKTIKGKNSEYKIYLKYFW